MVPLTMRVGPHLHVSSRRPASASRRPGRRPRCRRARRRGHAHGRSSGWPRSSSTSVSPATRTASRRTPRTPAPSPRRSLSWRLTHRRPQRGGRRSARPGLHRGQRLDHDASTVTPRHGSGNRGHRPAHPHVTRLLLRNRSAGGRRPRVPRPRRPGRAASPSAASSASWGTYQRAVGDVVTAGGGVGIGGAPDVQPQRPGLHHHSAAVGRRRPVLRQLGRQRDLQYPGLKSPCPSPTRTPPCLYRRPASRPACRHRPGPASAPQASTRTLRLHQPQGQRPRTCSPARGSRGTITLNGINAPATTLYVTCYGGTPGNRTYEPCGSAARPRTRISSAARGTPAR